MDNNMMNIIKNIMKQLAEIRGYCVKLDNNVKALHNDHLALYNKISMFNDMHIKSQVPYMTPKQLVALSSRGWSIEELSTLSGYSVEDVNKKIQSYKNV